MSSEGHVGYFVENQLQEWPAWGRELAYELAWNPRDSQVVTLGIGSIDWLKGGLGCRVR